MIFKASIAIGLGIVITTIPLVFSSDSIVKFTNETKYCGDEVLLSCEVINTENQHQWYRLSSEKIQKILNESSILSVDQLSPYKVESTYRLENYKTGDVTLYFLTRFDTGWYTCLNLSTQGYPKVIRSIWLEVRCEGNEKKYHTEQQMEKIQNGIGPPYLIMKRIFCVQKGTNTVYLEICARGYPKPKYNITYVKNHQETSVKESNDLDATIGLRIPITELKVPTTLSFFVCNANGCINDTIHSIHVTGNRIVLEETPNQAIYLCCEHELINSIWKSKWFVNNRRKTTITETQIRSGFAAAHKIPETTYLDEGFYECQSMNYSNWITIGVFHLKIWNDSTHTPGTLSAEHGSSFTNQTTTNEYFRVYIKLMEAYTYDFDYHSSSIFEEYERKITTGFKEIFSTPDFARARLVAILSTFDISQSRAVVDLEFSDLVSEAHVRDTLSNQLASYKKIGSLAASPEKPYVLNFRRILPFQCSPTEIPCKYSYKAKCIPSSGRCDKKDTCLDGSDEEECPGPDRCEVDDKFFCPNSGGILVCASIKCDGKKDCPGGEDEPPTCDKKTTGHQAVSTTFIR
ncbi:uncharacterized protein LOC135843523 [Planococcus citri]|uniref:uncharacterized protein LOC135843523 n=1 Tax=Planococcus citri TaxID=170843 RepID=UPI0031F7E436